MSIHGGIALDLKRLARLRYCDDVELLCTAEAGFLGQSLEDELNRRGMTLGHFPSSIYCSTLGGWIATRSAGQMSSLYGKIEDMVVAAELVLGDGQLVRCDGSSAANLLDLFLGSEGTLAVITAATLRLHRLPRHRILRGYRCASVSDGCAAIRRLMQTGLTPAVVRLYDELDSLIQTAGDQRRQGTGLPGRLLRYLFSSTGEGSRSGRQHRLLAAALSRAGMLNGVARQAVARLGNGCLLIVGTEGEPALARAMAEACHEELLSSNAIDLGPDLGDHWYQHRYAVSFKQSQLLTTGILTDTMEVAATWDNIPELYRQVRAAAGKHALVLAHFSHAYVEGCSIYFTFALPANPPREARERYDHLWHDALSAVVRSGATISHHHGVGLSKSAFMADEHGEGMALYRAAKRLCDPRGTLNPGKMGL
jgi:alkyldihydroxyacetonephosphate synthase